MNYLKLYFNPFGYFSFNTTFKEPLKVFVLLRDFCQKYDFPPLPGG